MKDGMQILQELVKATKRKQALDNELKEVKAEIERLVEPAKNFFIENGIQNMRIEDRTPYLHRQVFASEEEDYTKKDVNEALREIGMEDIINYNSTSLNSYIKEVFGGFPELFNEQGSLIATEEQLKSCLPPPLARVLRIAEKIDIKVRR